MQDAPETLRVSGLVMDSIVDGPGLRLAVFTQGCPHACSGCHNPQSHDPAGGHAMPVLEIAGAFVRNPLLAGLTLTGGEPLMQAAACLRLLALLPEETNVWLYSGFTLEEILSGGDTDQNALLRRCTVLVDGRFVRTLRSLSLRFRGSSNQRLIDIQKTLAGGKGKVALWETPAW